MEEVKIPEADKIKELSKAMALAFSEIKCAGFDKKNPYFSSKYASLGAVVDAIKPALSKYGIWFVQRIHPIPGYAAVETVIMHSSGESFSCGITTIPVIIESSAPKDGEKKKKINEAQAYGSAISYAKRYSLSSAFSVVSDEDDDGNSACPQPEQQAPAPRFQAAQTYTMSPEDLKRLAAKVVVEISNDPLLSCSIDPGDMLAWLTYCQSKAENNIRSSVETLLSNDKQKLLSSFEGWIAKRDSQLA